VTHSLQERKALEWGADVDLIFSDMRAFRPGNRADLIVSELLGSFGDNELSPECLDGVMRWLKPDGASIPASYTSYLAPLTSAKLHAEVAGPNTSDPVKMSEQPYVVMFQAAHILSSAGGRGAYERIQPCWDFHHPRPDVVVDTDGLPITNGHNARTAHLTFHIPEAGVCHGFAGYFDAVLYNDVMISIHPERMDVRQLSWFPIFFPLRVRCPPSTRASLVLNERTQDPMYLPGGCELDVHLSRLTDHIKRRIWFEWTADAHLWLPSTAVPHPTAIVVPPADALSPQSVRSPRLPWGDAFASAPSPRLPTGANGSSANPMESGPPLARIKIAETRLQNPLGRSSCVADRC
jgi:protein arginine N-methyltransferase 5